MLKMVTFRFKQIAINILEKWELNAKLIEILKFFQTSFLSMLQLQLLYIVVIRATNKNINTSYDKRAV